MRTLTAVEIEEANLIRDRLLDVIRTANELHAPEVVTAGFAAFLVTILTISTDVEKACDEFKSLAEQTRSTFRKHQA